MEKANEKPFYISDHAIPKECVVVGVHGNTHPDGFTDAKMVRDVYSGEAKGTSLLAAGYVDPPTPFNTELGNIPHKMALPPGDVNTVGTP